MEQDMKNKGFSHIDLATKDMAATRAFYEGILGFPVVRSDVIEFEAGGRAEHVFFDCGNGQMIAFAHSARFPETLDTGINKGLKGSAPHPQQAQDYPGPQVHIRSFRVFGPGGRPT